MPPQLYWLPDPPSQWAESLAALKPPGGRKEWETLERLANHRVDFVQTSRLDRALRRLFASPPEGLATKPVRLALLASSTSAHLIPGIRVAALRRGIWVDIYEAGYAQYWQELTDESSGLNQFHPDVVLFAIDGRHLLAARDSTVEAALETFSACWHRARDLFGCTVIQQAVLPVFPSVLGGNEHNLQDSPQWKLQQLNVRLRELVATNGVVMLGVDKYAESDGMKEWHDPGLWHRAKQEIHPRVSHIYGDLTARLLAALQGRSYKCAVLDLDNTLWGGVIGDDGLAGLLLGQGHAVGEAHIEFQRFLQELGRRGVILAVCSKNDDHNARLPFCEHPEMVLREADIACFVANWNDKASNLRQIAANLNIGLDSLVFVDDNPFERNLVRQELPMVAVPELPEDPSFYAACLSDSGYFEAVSVTVEDRNRADLYRANADREAVKQNATDITGYLQSLKMELIWKEFDLVSLPRIVQLINKTNQFNLTTLRYTEANVLSMMGDPEVIKLYFRLTDRFGDNGIISVVICKLTAEMDLLIDSWLMSCRVLGRQVEETTLNVVASTGRLLGTRNLIGEYRPTAKNGMVEALYRKLGFDLVSENPDGSSRWTLDVANYRERPSYIRVSAS
ncbi:MAG TPA: HAD-IIIC family phosphatase [Bryobacteraceae bacterium]|nr:HAD-IIIC family phosphatase [Bryobacteraceae bacterium]HTF64447.1 HAD-IIIC family phosphatase [Edaphobacter sp.]